MHCQLNLFFVVSFFLVCFGELGAGVAGSGESQPFQGVQVAQESHNINIVRPGSQHQAAHHPQSAQAHCVESRQEVERWQVCHCEEPQDQRLQEEMRAGERVVRHYFRDRILFGVRRPTSHKHLVKCVCINT